MNKLDNNFQYPKTGTTKRVIWGSLFNILGEGIGILKNLLLVPLFLGSWGILVYGEWLAIYALVGYLTLANIGMQSFVINRLTQAYARGNLEEFTEIFHSALRLYLIIAGVLLLIFAGFVFSCPFTSLLNITITNENMVKAAAFVLGTYLLFTVPFGLIIGLYQSLGEYPRRAMFINTHHILLVGFLALALFFKSNFIIVSSMYFIPMSVLTVFMLYDIKRRHPEIQLGFSRADWKLSTSFIRPGLLFLLIPLADALKIQGGVLVLSVSLGAATVTTFVIHRTLSNLIFRLTDSVNRALWPELTVAQARKDYKKIQLAHNFLIKVSLFLSLSSAVFLFFSGKDIIRIWTQDKIVFHPLLWLILLAYLPVNCLWRTSGIFQVSTNQYKLYSFCRILSGVFGIIFAVVLTRLWGVVGVLLGFVIAELIFCGWIVPGKTLRIVRLKKTDFLFNTVAKGLVIVIPQILVGWTLSNYTFNIFLQWILLIVGIFSVGVLFTWLFWLDEEEKKKSSQLVKACLLK